MKMILLILICFSSCAAKIYKKPAMETKEFEPETLKIFPGQIRFLSIDLGLIEYDQDSILECFSEKFSYDVKDNFLQVYIRYPYFSPVKNFNCTLEHGPKKIIIANFVMDTYEYQSERLYVDKKRLYPSKEDQSRVWKEQQVLNKVYASSPNMFYFNTPFQEPLDSFVTSKYGKKRIYNNKKQSQHLGTDYRAAIGVKVPAANRGRVVISRDLFYTGNTVILDHGFGIFTVYGHLSKRLVKENDIISKGDVLGLAGMTGRVTGPHLHWGVKVGGQYIDGPMLVTESQKQFDTK